MPAEMPESEIETTDVLVDVGHLREPFVEDLRGVILSTSTALVGPDGLPRPGVSAEVAFDVLVSNIMELVDQLACEITNEAMDQMAAQMGGMVIYPELTVAELEAMGGTDV